MKQLKFAHRQFGQGMTEYIIIVALVAIGAITVYQFFGKTIQNQTTAIAQELSGQNGTAAKTAAQTAANAAATNAATTKTLNNYTNNVGNTN